MNINTKSPEVVKRLKEIDNLILVIRQEVGSSISGAANLKGAATVDRLKKAPAKEIKQLCHDLLSYSYFRVLEVQNYQAYN